MSTVVSGESNNQNQLHQFVALASHIFLVAVSFCHSLVSNLTRWSFSPFILLYPIISYLVSPFLVFAKVIAHLVFILPFGTTCYILDSMYPIYVFCGVACITGIIAGLGGRGLSAILTRAFAKSEREGDPSAHVPMARGNERGNERRNRRRRLRIRVDT